MTLRELVLMFDAKQAAEGERAAWIAHAAINAQRDRKSWVSMRKMNPWRRKPTRRTGSTVQDMGKALFGVDIDQVKREMGLA